MKGLTLRHLILSGTDVVAEWGRVPLLLVHAGRNEPTAPFLFDTPRDPKLVETSEMKTGLPAPELSEYCAPESVVTPVHKTHRNSFSDVIVGRATNCDVRFTHPSVSKVHAYLRPPADPYGIWTLWEPSPSTNGTFVDGLRLDPFPVDGDARSTTAHVFQVAPGRRLRFGDVECLFLDAEGIAQTLQYAVELWTASGLAWQNPPTGR